MVAAVGEVSSPNKIRTHTEPIVTDMHPAASLDELCVDVHGRDVFCTQEMMSECLTQRLVEGRRIFLQARRCSLSRRQFTDGGSPGKIRAQSVCMDSLRQRAQV